MENKSSSFNKKQYLKFLIKIVKDNKEIKKKDKRKLLYKLKLKLFGQKIKLTLK
jgi:hypothetical protein